MSYRRMAAAEAALEAEVGAWLAQAEAADAADDAEYGAERRGDETPDWVHDKQRRLEKIRAAKAALEAEAQAEAAAQAEAPKRYRGGREPKRSPGQPGPTAQRNFTDPESRIMKGKDGFVQACNAQAAVDARAQIVVACGLANNAADQAELWPLQTCCHEKCTTGWTSPPPDSPRGEQQQNKGCCEPPQPPPIHAPSHHCRGVRVCARRPGSAAGSGRGWIAAGGAALGA